MQSIIRDDHGRLVPVVRPKYWLAASVKRSRDRTDRIMRSRKQRKARLAKTQWVEETDRRGICELEASGIEWRSVEHWLDALDPREAFVARMVVKQILQTLADDTARAAERFEARPGAAQTADRRRHCRLRTYAAEPGQYIVFQNPPRSQLENARDIKRCSKGIDRSACD